MLMRGCAHVAKELTVAYPKSDRRVVNIAQTTEKHEMFSNPQFLIWKNLLCKVSHKLQPRINHKVQDINLILRQAYFAGKLMSSYRKRTNSCGNGERHCRPEPSTPLFKFGIITDVQYGDVNDRLNYEGTVMRYYRNSVNLLMNAIDTWKSDGPKLAPDFVLQLGDLIEGSRVEHVDREQNLKKVADCCLNLNCYFCHLWGNHEFYLFSRQELARTALNSKLEIAKNNSIGDNINGHESMILINDVLHRQLKDENSGDKYYFTFSPHPYFKFIALDSYDTSICGRQNGEPEIDLARKILSKNNDNADWNNPIGLKERHFVKFNGGMGQEQLKWLDNELKVADQEGQNVVLMSHVPIHPGSSSDICLLWNHQEALDVIQQHPCVKVCFYGHTHDGKSCVDEKGIHHITYPAVLECKPGQNAFATAYVYENRIEITGYGVIDSCVINI